MTTPLDTRNEFIARHIGPREADTQAMLDLLGHASLDALTDSVVPASIRGTAVLPASDGLGEAEALALLRSIAEKNKVLRTFIGQGYYNTHTPAPILRNLLENPAWYTAYTPYQPEISQGRLEALLNFQTLVSDLTGMEIANASLLDEGTAVAEAMTFCKRLSKNKRRTRSSSRSIAIRRPSTSCARAPSRWAIDVVVGDEFALEDVSKFFGAALQYPATNGDVHDLKAIVDQVPRGQRARRGRRRPARAHAADAAGRIRRGPGHRQRAALRRAARLRRPARGVLRDEGRLQARHAGPRGRHLDRPPRQAGLSPRDADARAAHPPREGDLQHLHRAGVAGQHRQHVRGLPRAGRAAGDRRAHARAHRRSSPPA